MKLSARSDVAPFHVMHVLAAAAARQETHGDAIMLCVGQPSTPAPRAVLDHIRAALDHDVMGYSAAAGRADARHAVAGLYRRRYGIEVDPRDVVLTTGASGGFLLTLLAAFEPGDVLAMTRPGYPAYRNAVVAQGCRVLDLPVDGSTRYQPTVQMLDQLPTKPAGLVIASPANPTGTVVERERLAGLAQWCSANDCLLLSDEIYHGIEFGAAQPGGSLEQPAGAATAWQFDRSSVVIGSLSKYFSMTGWRLGWLLAAPRLRDRIDLLQGNLAICAPTIAQVAAVAAVSEQAQPELDGHVQRYATNRELLLRRLPELGISAIAPPDGAFYLYCDIAHLTEDTQDWCAQMLDRTGVAVAPGVDFDPVDGHRFVRFSFCGDSAQIDAALARLVAVNGS
ncbi:MAG: aspartate aminotransferase [Micrococcales bacterium]|nr:MAG: aspartate aminotransferase [Micrococcales bacterium]PIE27688.1 MAG: aspartate aminotransferase [Micrococcales bacterium]